MESILSSTTKILEKYLKIGIIRKQILRNFWKKQKRENRRRRENSLKINCCLERNNIIELKIINLLIIYFYEFFQEI
jgi:hypothetical protein